MTMRTKAQYTTAIGYLFFLVKATILSIPQILKKLLLKMAVVFVVLIVVNVWLTVVPNGGFSLNKYNHLWPITVARNNRYMASMFWGIFMYFLFISYARVKRDGFRHFFVELVTSPVVILNDFRLGKRDDMAFFFMGASLFLVITLLIRNPYLLMILCLMVFMSYTLQERGVVVTFFRLATNDVNPFLKRKIILSSHGYSMMVLSVVLAGLIALMIPNFWTYKIIAALICLIIGILLYSGKIEKGMAVMFLGWLFVGVLLQRLSGIAVHADDGGWLEAGGTFGDWIGSAGSGTAVGMSVGPATTGTIGAGVGASAGAGIGSASDSGVGPESVPGPESGPGPETLEGIDEPVIDEGQPVDDVIIDIKNEETALEDPLEEAFGEADLGDVKPSTSSEADEEAQELGAQTYAEGSIDQESDHDSLVAEEASHTVQYDNEEAPLGEATIQEKEASDMVEMSIKDHYNSETNTEDRLEEAFGEADLGDIKPSISSEADEKAQELGAQTYAEGSIDQESDHDSLFAEEVSHTMQYDNKEASVGEATIQEKEASDMVEMSIKDHYNSESNIEDRLEEAFGEGNLGDISPEITSQAENSSIEMSAESYVEDSFVQEGSSEPLIAEEISHTLHVRETVNPLTDAGKEEVNASEIPDKTVKDFKTVLEEVENKNE